jgi:hypothetical protein
VESVEAEAVGEPETVVEPRKRADRIGRPRKRSAAVVTLALVLCAVAVTGCAAINKARTSVHDIEGNKATIDAFTDKVQSGEASPFQATYVTTGSSPATIVYAVRPPTGLSFTDTPTGAGSPTIDLVVNSSGEFSCTPPASTGAAWSCQKLDPAGSARENQLFDFYTPAHWVSFLKGFSLVAGLAGDKVSSSNMTVNGFNMQCVDFVAPGVSGTSTICTTPQNILGYVKVASDSTSFQITSYSASPPASLFETPPGATITPVQTGTS